MYCNNCKKEIPDNVDFCPECGCQNGVLNIDESKKKKSPKATYIIVAVVALLVITAVVLFLSRYNFVSKIILNSDEIELKVTNSKQLSYIVSPEFLSDVSVIWSSSNDAIVSVTQDGEITGVAPGKCDVYVKTGNGKEAVCSVTVVYPDYNIKFDESSIEIELPNSKQLTYSIDSEIEFDFAKNIEVTWGTSDDSVATVDSYGNITAVKSGTCEITVKAENGKEAVCEVKVVNSDPIVRKWDFAAITYEDDSGNTKIIQSSNLYIYSSVIVRTPSLTINDDYSFVFDSGFENGIIKSKLTKSDMDSDKFERVYSYISNDGKQTVAGYAKNDLSIIDGNYIMLLSCDGIFYYFSYK